jgi:hypothetical protein
MSPTDTQPFEPLDVRIARGNAELDRVLALMEADFRASAIEVQVFDETGIEPVGFELVR